MSELAITVGCFYEGTPVSFGVVADAMGVTVGALCTLLRAERGVRVVRDWKVRGPASMRLVPEWAVAS